MSLPCCPLRYTSRLTRRLRCVHTPTFTVRCTSSQAAAAVVSADEPTASHRRRRHNNVNDVNNKYTLQYFMANAAGAQPAVDADDEIAGTQPLGIDSSVDGAAVQSAIEPLTYYIETYGCQMNTADTELVCSILDTAGHTRTHDVNNARVMLVNTCAIRDGAESKVHHRINYFKSIKQPKRTKHSADNIKPIIVVLGCMAERLKTQMLEQDKLVDIVCGPDSYRSLPHLLTLVTTTHMQYSNTQLSMDESYADIRPVRSADQYGVSAFTSITRGCNNLCSYCIVPYTRGVERSRNIDTILDEVKQLRDAGYREVTLLGQNVTSYNCIPDTQQRKLSADKSALTPGFVNISRRPEMSTSFTDLLDRVSLVDPKLRVRFTSPHPKDTPVELIQLIADRPNICSQFHLPAQSGSSTVLQRMRRGYTRDAYLNLVDSMKRIIGPSLSLSTDMISGFCGETDAEHQDTLSLMQYVQYDSAFMFAYNTRPKTHAYHKLADDVPPTVKQQRLQQVIDTFHATLVSRNQAMIDTVQLLLIDNIHNSAKNSNKFSGKLDNGRRCFIDQRVLPALTGVSADAGECMPTFGDYVAVKVTHATALSCNAEPLALCSLTGFYSMFADMVQAAQFARQHLTTSIHL